MIRAGFLFAILLLTCGGLHAQYTPVVAKVRETRDVFLNGQKQEAHIREGNFYRRSDGSTLEEWTVVDGASNRGIGSLRDNNAGLVFQLNLSSMTAIQRPKHLPARSTSIVGPPQISEPSDPSTKRMTIAGISCAVYPVGQGLTGITTTGQFCIAGQFNLTLQRDVTYTTNTTNGTKVDHTVYEVLEMHLNTEPDAKLFDLNGRGFTIFNPQLKPQP